MNLKFTRVLGVSLIVGSWGLWGILLALPFMKLTITQYAIAGPAILVSTNIFWIGAALVGKDLILKYNILGRIKVWLAGRSVK